MRRLFPLALVLVSCAGLETPKGQADQAKLSADVAVVRADEALLVAQLPGLAADYPKAAALVAAISAHDYIGAVLDAEALIVDAQAAGKVIAPILKKSAADVRVVVSDLRDLADDLKSKDVAAKALAASPATAAISKP